MEVAKAAEARPGANIKREYKTPVLQVYGRIADLTRGGGTSARSDAGANMMYT
jgi:hypothetical protein